MADNQRDILELLHRKIFGVAPTALIPLGKQVGTIIEINRRTGMFAVAIDEDDGDFVVFELQDSVALQVGDKIKGALDNTGSEELWHVGERREFSAYGQTGTCSRQTAVLHVRGRRR
jgi:hypothetical protein